MDGNRNRPNHLGINKISKNIRKSPLHQPTFTNPKQQQQQQSSHGGSGSQQPQPQVYNISKSDFRSVVQQLTGTPTRDPFPSSNPRPPPQNPPKAPSVRLQKIRPPPLTPIVHPPIPHPSAHQHPVNPNLNPNFYARPVRAPAAAAAQSPTIPYSPLLPPTTPPGSTFWANTLESPISAYMRYLESSIVNTDGSWQTPRQFQAQQRQQAASQRPPPGQMHHPAPPPRPPLQQGQTQASGSATYSSGLLPNPHVAAPFPSPRSVVGPPPLPSPGLLPSPTSPFILPSPSAFLNLMSPRSPFPLLSPRFQYPLMATDHAYSSLGGQPGILGPGPQPLSSPGLMFPQSPSGFLPIMSPRWRNL